MDPSRHHDFLSNSDDHSNRNTYYGHEIPEITSHHYYGPATTSNRGTVSSSTRKPCGCTATGSGSMVGNLTCNSCRLNPADEGSWPTAPAMANTNQVDHSQRGNVGMGMGGDYHLRMPAADSNVRSNVRQNTAMYVQQHPHQLQQQPTHGSGIVQTQHQHAAHVGNMAANRTSYWPQSNSANSGGSLPYGAGSGGDEHLGGLPTQVDISVARRNTSVSNDYSSYKSTSTSMPTAAAHAAPQSSSSSSSINASAGAYQLPSSSLNTSNPLHQRVSAIGGGVSGAPGIGQGPTNVNTPYMTKERIYEHQKYSATTAKMTYNTTATAMYDSAHHHMNNQVIGKSLPIDHHVINPSNFPATKEQHPSPNYARKCPQMYAPEEQSTAHQHLYMSTPQFSSDKFTRASIQQPQTHTHPQPQPPPPSDFTKLRESPSGSSFMVAPHSDKYNSPHMHASSHLRESPQFPSHSTASPRNPSSYYGASQSHNQNPSKIHPPEMSPIIMKQSHHTHHYQYSKSPLPLPPPLPPSHMQHQQTIPPSHSSHIAAKNQATANMNIVAQPSAPAPSSHVQPAQHSQRYLMDNVKREDLEVYENSQQMSSRHSGSGTGSGIGSGSSIYINPYNTPPPTGDNCCKDGVLSASPSSYTTGSATPNYRVESPQYYPTKYAKLVMNENLSSSKHSLINQNTPPPSRAPSQRGQNQSNYYYEGNSHSAPSPAAATAASPSPSALLTTTTSQTPMHHTEYMSSTMQTGPAIGPASASELLVGSNMSQSYATQPTLSAQSHHLQHNLHHAPASASLRNNDLMLTAQTNSSHNSYERAIHHPPAGPVAPSVTMQHLKSKHALHHPSSTSSPTASGPVANLQMQQMQQMQANANTAKAAASKHQKPNYRELINQKLAMRNATSEEELNMQIIKKTLNVDTQNIRGPPQASTTNQLPQPMTASNRGISAMSAPQLQAARESSASLKQTNTKSSVLVGSHTAGVLPMPSTTVRIIDLPEAMSQRICIKQEDDKPSSSSGSTSSPLDLSMRTVKTKADSTDYKYQQVPRLPTAAASSSTSASYEGRYSLPRVDSTPIFSVHAFEPGAAVAAAAASAAAIPTFNRQPSSRHSSLERRNYTPPSQQPQVTHATTPGVGGVGTSYTYSPSSTQHIPVSGTTNLQYSKRRNDVPNNLTPQTANATMGCYENSLVIKTAPKLLNNLNSDLIVRPSTITAQVSVTAQPNAQTSRPSVLETNPYATVIKTENKQRFNETPPSSPHHATAAVERLPPDTSIMALPARNPYGVVRSAIQKNNNANISSSNSTPTPPPSNYTLACEKNPNFRKRHLQEYSNQMSLNETEAKHKCYMDLTPASVKPIQIPMRPADISVIAVNDLPQQEVEHKPRIGEVVASIKNTSVIASTAVQNSPKVIVNNCSPTSSSVVVVCKQEPLTPTGDNPNSNPLCNKPPEMPPTNTFSSRIRTKAELKGFTFNPPPPLIQTPEINNSPTSPPPKLVTIKQEEEDVEDLIPAEKIKEEIVSKIEFLTAIPGLEDEFQEKSLLDFGWSNTCNNFMEQLMTRPPSSKKKTQIKAFTTSDETKPFKDSAAADMIMVTSSEAVTKTPLDIQSFFTMESADNTTRSSFARLDAGVESSITFTNNPNQDSINSQYSTFAHKKLSKSDREKKRFQQEKRLAERLKAKQSSSESEDELDKRKTERLKKPLMKTKHKLKSPKSGSNTHSNSSSSSCSATLMNLNKNRFSECGSDSSSTEAMEENNSSNIQKKSPIKLEINKEKEKVVSSKIKVRSNEAEKCDNDRDNDKKEKQEDKTAKKSCNNSKTAKEEKQISKKEEEVTKRLQETNTSNSSSSSEEDDSDDEGDEKKKAGEREENIKISPHSKEKLSKQALNTMTRSKHKLELEQQLANSKVLRNEKIIRNFSANSLNKIKRKYTRKYNTVNSLLESGGLSRESGIMKSNRLRAKFEKNGGKLNLIKNSKSKTITNLENSKNKSENENVHDRNVIDLYRFKRALKVPPSLINIKHPGTHKIAASLPDLERHAEALEAYAKKREKKSSKIQNKIKSAKGGTTTSSKVGKKTQKELAAKEEPKSIIDLLHSRVTKASGINVLNKSTTTTATTTYRPIKPCCATSSTNNTKAPASLSHHSNNNNNNCGIFSETSQTTESSELQMLPELKKDSDIEDDHENNGNEDCTTANGKKRHFSIFDTKVLATKTRTESKMQQKKENIREIFVGDDRPASAPPEMTQMLDSVEKMTYEQKYEQFLQQMNIVVSADTLGRLGRSAGAKKLPSTTANDKQEEGGDTESTSVIDADDLKEDQKSSTIPNHFRKRRGKYLRRKGSSGFDYIRKKKKPTPSSASLLHSAASSHHNNHNNNGPYSHLHHPYSARSEKYDMDEYEHKIKTEDDVSREIQKWVLNKGVGQSAMHKAARQGYIDVIVYCLDRMGMNPDQKDNAGYTPLHEACTNGWLNIARVLLQYGANHSEAAHSGIRPLHEASENDHQEIVRLLLSYGADPLLATYSGQTPLMLASSKTMRDILSNHLVDVQSMGPERKPWQFNGPWEIYDSSECGYNVFEGAPYTVCDTSRALLRRSSLNYNQMHQNNKKLPIVLNNTTNTTIATTTTTSVVTTTTTTQSSLTHNFSITTSAPSCQSANNNNNTNNNNTAAASSTSKASLNKNNNNSVISSSSGSGGAIQPIIEAQQQKQQQQQQQQLTKVKGETNTKTVMEKCAVVLDNIDRFNSVRLHNDNKPEILVENSDSDGEMFEFEEADVLLPPLYLLKDEGTQDKWVLLNDLCNLLKVKSKDTLLNKIYPSTTSSSSASVASAHKSHMRELKMSDFLEKATCLQLLCAGEKLNICASKVVLIKYNENVRNLLGVKTILMKF